MTLLSTCRIFCFYHYSRITMTLLCKFSFKISITWRRCCIWTVLVAVCLQVNLYSYLWAFGKPISGIDLYFVVSLALWKTCKFIIWQDATFLRRSKVKTVHTSVLAINALTVQIWILVLLRQVKRPFRFVGVCIQLMKLNFLDPLLLVAQILALRRVFTGFSLVQLLLCSAFFAFLVDHLLDDLVFRHRLLVFDRQLLFTRLAIAEIIT